MIKRQTVTRQGVRDLGGNSRVRQDPIVEGSTHVWEPAVGYDCMASVSFNYLRCGLCHASKR
jgi:hypothetical protein